MPKMVIFIVCIFESRVEVLYQEGQTSILSDSEQF